MEDLTPLRPLYPEVECFHGPFQFQTFGGNTYVVGYAGQVVLFESFENSGSGWPAPVSLEPFRWSDPL